MSTRWRKIRSSLAAITQALCLLLILVSIVLWVRSYWWGDSLRFRSAMDTPQYPKAADQYVPPLVDSNDIYCLVEWEFSCGEGSIAASRDYWTFRLEDTRDFRKDPSTIFESKKHQFASDLKRGSSFLGMGLQHRAWGVNVDRMGTHFQIRFRIWHVLFLAAIPPAISVYRFWKRRRRLQPLHLCAHCRYDLTGNTSGVCPECGVPKSNSA